MSGLNEAFLMVTGALGRKLRNYGAARRTYDHLEAATSPRVNREELERLFDMPRALRNTQDDEMRHSEWLERQSRQRIRAALHHGERS